MKHDVEIRVRLKSMYGYDLSIIAERIRNEMAATIRGTPYFEGMEFSVRVCDCGSDPHDTGCSIYVWEATSEPEKP